MSPVLLAPLGLAALLALIVPALIHLHRRIEEVPLDFAAMRWLEQRPRPQRKLQFEELLLLALRLALIALLAVLLTRPAVFGWSDESTHVLVAPGVKPAAAREFAGPEDDLRWIAPQFPALEQTDPVQATQISSLIRQYDAELDRGAELTILVPPLLDGLDAEPLRLTRSVTWQVVEGFDNESTAPAARSLSLVVRYDDRSAGALRYLSAAAQAWSDEPQFDAATTSELPTGDDVLIWLIAGPVPQAVTDWAREGGTVLLGHSAETPMPAATTALWRERGGEPVVDGAPLGAGRLMRFTRPLAPAAMPVLLDAGFAERLRDLVAPPAPPPARAVASAFEPSEGARPYPVPAREFGEWLAVLIALIFAAERLLATRRRRFAA